jgi:hypothetical protein
MGRLMRSEHGLPVSEILHPIAAEPLSHQHLPAPRFAWLDSKLPNADRISLAL